MGYHAELFVREDHGVPVVVAYLPEDAAKDAEADVQKFTDAYSKKIEDMLAMKEKDIMSNTTGLHNSRGFIFTEYRKDL